MPELENLFLFAKRGKQHIDDISCAGVELLPGLFKKIIHHCDKLGREFSIKKFREFKSENLADTLGCHQGRSQGRGTPGMCPPSEIFHARFPCGEQNSTILLIAELCLFCHYSLGSLGTL